MNMYKYFLSFVFLSFSTFLYAEKINSIKVQGLDSVSRGTVLNYLPLETGDEYSLDSSDSIIKELYKTGLFKNVSVSFEENIVSIIVKENPVIKFVEFADLSDSILPQEKINDILKSIEIETGDIFAKKKLDSLIKVLKSAYSQEGFYNAKFKEEVDLDSKNRIGIKIKVLEGKRALVKKFRINGAKVFSLDDLIDLFEIGEADFFIINFFTEKDHFNQFSLDAGIEKLLNKYLSEGYLDVSIDKDIKVLDADQVHIDINITEGNLYKIGQILYPDDEYLNQFGSFDRFFDISSGDSIKRSKLISSIKSIEKFLRDQGFVFAKVSTNLVNTQKKYSLDVEIKIDLDVKTYINRINISGNFKTQDNVIRREISLVEGQVFSQKDLDKSVKNLKKLGFFSDVNISYARSEYWKDKLDVFVKVEETKTGEISFGLAHSNTTGASFTAGIAQRNFLGTGTELNANLSNSTAVKELNLYVKEPYLTLDKQSISYGIFSKQTDGSNLELSSYEIDKKGLVMGYGYAVSNDANIFGEFKYSNIDVICDGALSLVEEQCSLDSNIDSPISISYSSDSTDDFIFPTSGKKIRSKFSLSLPYSDFKYWKSENSYKYYTPLNKNITFKSAVEMALGGGYSSKDLPFFERFYAGGASSLRGFNFNSIGPKYNDPNKTSKGGDVSLTGTFALSRSLKFSNVNDGNIKGVAFLDYGNVFEKISDVKLDELRVSTGLQLNWRSPIGPIGFYYAVPVIKEDGDETENFAVKLGAFF